eukprot:2678037-Rhodomonas_salina.1
MVLRVVSALSSTDAGYCGTRLKRKIVLHVGRWAGVKGLVLQLPYLVQNASYCAMELLCDVRYGPRVCCYALAMRCPVLRECMLLCNVGYLCCYAVFPTSMLLPDAVPTAVEGGGQRMALRGCYAMSGTEIAYAATRVLGDVRY